MAGDRGKARQRLSWQLRGLRLAMRWLVKPRLARLLDPRAARRELEWSARLFFRPPPLSLWLDGSWPRPDGTALPLARISWGQRVDRSRVILYLHGGAYVAGSPRTYRAMLAAISRHSGVPVVAPAYRLAPEAPFPAALEDARIAWRALVDSGYDPEDVVIGGDSAGGGLALSLLSELCGAGAAPAGVFLLSPWTDLTGEAPSLRENASRDPLLPAARVAEIARMYLQGRDPADPAASPLRAEFREPPPVLFQHGQDEILRDDTLRMAERLRGFGADVRVQSWAGVPHAWQIFACTLPEAREAIAQIGLHVRSWLNPRDG